MTKSDRRGGCNPVLGTAHNPLDKALLYSFAVPVLATSVYVVMLKEVCRLFNSRDDQNRVLLSES